ncbi:MAG: hypothetical protein EXR72_15410 [Myxococcales bacterium]|nr:hypothetical protein [Myxococcales bacterium]
MRSLSLNVLGPALALLLPLAACTAGGLNPGTSDGGPGDGGAEDGAGVDASGRSCGALQTDVQQWITSHQMCQVDGDCAATTTRCGLPATCGTYLNQAGLAGLGGFLGAWDRQACGAAIKCSPCAGDLAAAGCNAGRCGAKFSCGVLRAQIEGYLAVHRSCKVDADCSAPATECGLPGVCGAFIRRDAEPGLDALLDQWNAHTCYEGQPCPDCAPPDRASCKQGTCGPL